MVFGHKLKRISGPQAFFPTLSVPCTVLSWLLSHPLVSGTSEHHWKGVWPQRKGEWPQRIEEEEEPENNNTVVYMYIYKHTLTPNIMYNHVYTCAHTQHT